MRIPTRRSLLATTVAAAFVFTTGFGFGKKDEEPPKVYDPAASADSQAGTFVSANKAAEKGMKGVGKVALTSCSVMFAFKSNASAATSGGLFSEMGSDKRRVDEKIYVEYNLVGADDATMQALTDRICAGAEQRLKAAGFDVLPVAELAGNAHFQGMHSNGQPGPHEYKMPGGNTRYMVYAPTGQQLVDGRFAALGGAFKLAKGQAPEQHEGRLVDELKISPVRVNFLVDFATVKGDGTKTMGGLVSKDTAEVKGDVRLSVTGELSVRPAEAYKCWKSLKGRDCALNPAKDLVVFNSAAPVVSADAFYKQVADATTRGDKIGAGVTKGLAMLSAMGGVSATSADITRYNVEVDPAQYGAEAQKYLDGFLDMALVKARAAK